MALEPLTIWNRQCDRKIPYQTKEQAECEMNNLIRSGKNNDHPLNVYLCRCGNHFHVGRVPESAGIQNEERTIMTIDSSTTRTEQWLEDRKLKIEPTLNDEVEKLHWKLINNKDYLKLLEAVWDEDAVEGSLAADNHEAARMIRNLAQNDEGSIIGTKKLATITKCLNVVLRRYHKSRKERRHMVAGEIVPNNDNE